MCHRSRARGDAVGGLGGAQVQLRDRLAVKMPIRGSPKSSLRDLKAIRLLPIAVLRPLPGVAGVSKDVLVPVSNHGEAPM